MATQNNREIIKELDYSVIVGDDAMLQVGTDCCRLIVYQEALEVSEDGANFEKDKRTISLKCEIRLPFRTMNQLANHALALLARRNKVTRDVNILNDPELNNAWWRFNDKLGKIIADTREGSIDQRTLDAMVDEYEAISIRADRRLGQNVNDGQLVGG